MFVDASPIYTDPAILQASGAPIVFANYNMQKERNVTLYSSTELRIHSSKFSFSVTVEKQKLRPTPTHIKKAMSRASQKAAIRALK